MPLTMKTPDQLRVSNLEYTLNSNHGFTLKTKTVPDKDHPGYSIWTVEATSRINGSTFNSAPIKDSVATLKLAYLKALESVAAQIKAFYEARGDTF